MDDVVGIRVTLGVNGAQADLCRSPDFPGCIVARRSLHFIPHTALVLPIQMQQSCIGQICDPNSTCVNGACVDAGISCDQTNTCALPVPDAGTCGLVPTLVVPLASPATPHMVRTSAGYAIGYATNAAQYDVVLVNANGGVTSPIHASFQAMDLTIPVGALGTDGTNYVVSYASTGGLALDEAAPDGGFLTSDLTGFNQPQAPLTGYAYDGTSFSTFITRNGTPTWVVWTPGGAAIGSSQGGTGYSDPAFAFYNGIDYASARDASGCYLFTATPSSSATPGFTFGATYQWPGCSTVRFAENARGVQLVAVEQGGLLRLQGNPSSAGSTAFGQVDPQAIAVLPAGGNFFHVVSGASDSIVRLDVDDTNIGGNQPVTVVQSTGFKAAGGVGIGFDAVADPSATSYAIAYWAASPNPGIYLTRFCQ